MKIGIVLQTKEPEKAWNAFRFATAAIEERGHDARVFLLGEGVEAENITHEEFNVREKMKSFDDVGGDIKSCGTCLELRQEEGSELCPFSTMIDCLEIVEWADKTLTF